MITEPIEVVLEKIKLKKLPIKTLGEIYMETETVLTKVASIRKRRFNAEKYFLYDLINWIKESSIEDLSLTYSNKNSLTPLHCAIYAQNRPLAFALIEKIAHSQLKNYPFTDRFNNSLLQAAILTCDYDLFKKIQLIDNNFNYVSEARGSVFDVAFDANNQILMDVAMKQSLKAIKEKLELYEKSLEESKKNPLLTFFYKDYPRIIEVLKLVYENKYLSEVVNNKSLSSNFQKL